MMCPERSTSAFRDIRGRTASRWRRRLPTVLLAGLALAAAGCQTGAARESSTTESVRTGTASANTEPETATSSPEPETEALEVDLRVVSGPGGVFAFAKVFINEKGPFAFTVDTGASRSVLDWDLVRRVGIDVIGEPVEITGITCRGEAGRVRVRKWRAGAVRLPVAEIQTVDMPEPPDGTAIDGLLGSDILSQFGAIVVDYDEETLMLRRRGGDEA